MTTSDEEDYYKNSPMPQEEILSAASSMPYLVSACLSAEEAKDLACKLIDSGLPVMVERLNGIPEGPCWLVFTDHGDRDTEATEQCLLMISTSMGTD